MFPPRDQPTQKQLDDNIEACVAAQELARTQGKRPFVAILIGPDNETVLLTHFSISHVEHAEACLARLAAIHFTSEYLWTCTLYSTWEPCAMCAATCYWANIGRVVYIASEKRLLELTGEGNEENMTLSLPCREVFAKGQKDILVEGPIKSWEDVVAKESDRYWKPLRDAKTKSG